MGYICDIPKEFCSMRRDDGSCTSGKPCLPIVEQCEGCAKVENNYCKAYIAPVIKWKLTKECPAATHIEREVKKFGKIRVGQQKSKRR